MYQSFSIPTSPPSHYFASFFLTVRVVGLPVGLEPVVKSAGDGALHSPGQTRPGRKKQCRPEGGLRDLPWKSRLKQVGWQRCWKPEPFGVSSHLAAA